MTETESYDILFAEVVYNRFVLSGKVLEMTISYNGLWKLLIDKKMQKKDLIEKLDISSATIAKMGKGEAVSVNVLERICKYMGCDIGDIMSFENDET